jgi:molybdopterin synthase sulfur carrier subunit
MPTLAFTANIQRHVACPPREVPGTSVRAVLEAAFADNPTARSYVLDDQGALRKHINIFVDGRLIRDRIGLTDAVGPEASVYVIQALSGG